MNKKQEQARAGLLAGIAYGKEQAKADRRLAAVAKLEKVLELVAVEDIRPRPGGDTRPARAEHVLELAETIAAVGLLQPLALDSMRRLLAGLHRLEAVRLLLLEKDKRLAYLQAMEGGDKLDPEETAEALAALPAPADLEDPLRAGKVPCLVKVDLDAERDPDAALAAEAAENTARRAYTPAEVQALAERLRRAGYRESGGRPHKGEKVLRPALEMVLGVSKNTARRLLGRMPAGGKGAQVGTFSETLLALRRPLARALESAPELCPSNKQVHKWKKLQSKHPSFFQVLSLLRSLEEELEEALADAKTIEGTPAADLLDAGLQKKAEANTMEGKE